MTGEAILIMGIIVGVGAVIALYAEWRELYCKGNRRRRDEKQGS